MYYIGDGRIAHGQLAPEHRIAACGLAFSLQKTLSRKRQQTGSEEKTKQPAKIAGRLRLSCRAVVFA
jgi:hypothetical protein